MVSVDHFVLHTSKATRLLESDILEIIVSISAKSLRVLESGLVMTFFPHSHSDVA